jgi:hypothetical protein
MDRFAASRTRRSVMDTGRAITRDTFSTVPGRTWLRGISNAKRPTSDVSRASALWTVSIGERAGRPIRTPCSTGSLVRFSRAPITPHETDDRFAPLKVQQSYDRTISAKGKENPPPRRSQNISQVRSIIIRVRSNHRARGARACRSPTNCVEAIPQITMTDHAVPPFPQNSINMLFDR